MTIKKDDLIQQCPDCNGEGKIYDPPREKREGNSYGSRKMGYSTETSCFRCKSTGSILTEEGEAIAEVVQLLRRQHRW